MLVLCQHVAEMLLLGNKCAVVVHWLTSKIDVNNLVYIERNTREPVNLMFQVCFPWNFVDFWPVFTQIYKVRDLVAPLLLK